MADEKITNCQAPAREIDGHDIHVPTTDESGGIIIETGHPLDIILHQVLNHGLIAVNAPAGSLMLVDQKQGILQVKARLGPPRRRRSEPVYKIRGSSIASQVVQHKRSYVCSDVEADRNFIPWRSGRSFLSLLSVPIIHSGEVIAVINADSPEKGYFTDWHREQLERVVAAVAGPIAERISILDAIAAVGLELMRVPKNGGVGEVLLKVAKAAVRSLGADVVTLYQYDQKTDQFLVEGEGPTVDGELKYPTPMRQRIYSGDVPHTVVKNRQSGFYSDVRSQDFLTGPVDRPGDTPRRRFWEREEVCSMAALLLPARASENVDEEVVGVMFANYRSNHNFNIDERTALETFANYASVAILNARHEEQTRAEEARETQLAIMQSISLNFAHRMSDLAGTSRVATQLLRKKIPSRDRDARRYLKRIEDETEVLFKMATRITAPFRDGGPIVEDVNIIEIIDRQFVRLAKEYSKKPLVKDAPLSIPLVRSIGFQLEQVIHDLFSNSMEAMESVKQKRLIVSILPDPLIGKLQVRIKDNGTGIRAEMQERLFEPCVSTKENNLGIGLWWSRNFLRSTGGDLRLEWTALGEGTTFALDLQIAQGKEVPNRPHRKRTQKDVLIVDDNQDWRNMLVDAFKLELPKCSCDTAKNFGEAVDALAATDFKIVILDVRLGGVDNADGLKLLTEIEKIGHKAKVIVVSSYEEHDARTRDNGRVLRFVPKVKIKVPEFIRFVQSSLGSPRSLSPKRVHLQNIARCFISYSTKDQEFADRLCADLRKKGVDCWIAPHDIKAGQKLYQQISDAIRDRERLLLILSPHSMSSDWVETEITEARKREVEEERRVLFPLRLVDFKEIQQWRCIDPETGKDLAREIRGYFIPDFSNWRDHDAYQKSFQKLLAGLKGEKARAATAS